MNAYEKIIKIMREESSKQDNKSPFKLATMNTARTCTYGSIELDSDDLLIAEHLDGKLGKGDQVLIAPLSSDLYVIIEKVVEM